MLITHCASVSIIIFLLVDFSVQYSMKIIWHVVLSSCHNWQRKNNMVIETYINLRSIKFDTWLFEFYLKSIFVDKTYTVCFLFQCINKNNKKKEWKELFLYIEERAKILSCLFKFVRVKTHKTSFFEQAKSVTDGHALTAREKVYLFLTNIIILSFATIIILFF